MSGQPGVPGQDGLPGPGLGHDGVSGPGPGHDGVSGPEHDGAVPAPGPATSDSDPWYRVHPVSPLVRGWIAVLAIAFFWGQNWVEDLVMVGEESRDPSGDLRFTPDLFVVIAIGGGIILLVVLAFFLSWYFTKYQITERHVNVNSGVVFRQQRQARIDRVQAIDIAQPLLARMFGLAELKFEVADAGDTAMSLAFLKLDEAKRLRNAILARAAGLRAARGGAVPGTVPSGDASGGGSGGPGVGTAGGGPGVVPGAHPGLAGSPDTASHTGPGDGGGGTGSFPLTDPEAPEQVLVVVPPGRILGSVLLSPWLLMLVVFAVGGTIAEFATDHVFRVIYLVPGLFGFVPLLWAALNTGFNFRAATSPDGLRLSYGLLDTRHQTVPPGRVQAVQISQPVHWRRFGWHRVVVNVAGYGVGAGDSGAARSTVLPVGTREDVLNVLSIVLPDPGADDPQGLVDAGIGGSGPDAGFTTTPRRARWLAPLAWRRQGFAITRTALVARSGRIFRSLVLVPHERTQGLVLRQGPIARRFGVADVQLATTDGPVDPRIVQADAQAARVLFLEQADRAATARHLKDRDHWLEGNEDG